MTKEQYLFLLRAELDGYLSPEELEDILRYYSEYFEEAGQEQERNVMIELGSPQRLAERILEQRRAEDGLLGEPEPYIPNDGYGYYNEDNGRIPGWVMAILLGVAGLLALPTVGGLILGFGLGGIGCMLGGVIAVVVGSFSFGLAGKLFVVGGGLIAFAVGLLLFVAAVAIWRLTLQAVRYCRSKIREGCVVFHESEY